jgi:uracil-DNA glycosylase family 4
VERYKNIVNKMQNQITKDVRILLEFYQKLGFENIPIDFSGYIKKLTVGFARYKNPKPFLNSDKKTLLDALRQEMGDCRKCKLSSGRTHIVFGEGNQNARLIFIGEAPGREEDIQARPFVGDAGMLLTNLIKKMGFDRKDVYITNIVKCRPTMNRDPEIDEIENCRCFVEKQIEIIQPEVIMSLGRISIQTLMGNPKLKITAIRGKFFEYNGIPIMPTFHPAYLIRNPKDKWLTWDDAQKVVEKLKRKD